MKKLIKFFDFLEKKADQFNNWIERKKFMPHSQERYSETHSDWFNDGYKKFVKEQEKLKISQSYHPQKGYTKRNGVEL